MRTLSLFFLLGSTAFAQTTLSVSLRQQQTDVWCYAASTQMVAKYLGSDIDQCEIANRYYDRSDCCTNFANCDQDGGHTTETLDYWGFPHNDNDGPPSANFIRNEINANRPFITSWTWSGGGNHAVVVDGYWNKSDGLHVEVLNPLDNEKEWLTYQHYLTGGLPDDGDGSPFGDHTVKGTYANIHWGPICSYDFQGLDADDYQQCFDERTHHGNYPSDLAGGWEGLFSNGVMGGAFHGTTDRPVAWNNGLTTFDNWVDSHPGWRPDKVTVISGGTPLYSAILTEASNPWESHYHLDSNQFQSTFDSLDAAGYRLKDLFGYNDDGSPRFAGVWVKESGGYHANHFLALSDLESTDTTYRKAGYRLTRLSTYEDANGVWRAAALWLPSTVSYYRYGYNMSGAEYQAFYDTWHDANGYTLAYLSKYDDLYNAIFTK